MMFQNNIMSKDMHLANNNQNMSNFGATDLTPNIYQEISKQPQQIQSNTAQSMAISSSSPVQTMSFQNNLNGGYNGARLIAQNGTQQQHLMQIKPQDYMSNSVIPQQQQRINQLGYDGSPQHQQYQHQQQHQQSYYNQNVGNNGYSMNSNNNVYPAQSVQQNVQHNFNQFQQYQNQNQNQIQTNMQINQNKLGLQDDDISGVISNDLYSMQTQIQQQQHHQTYRNQAQLHGNVHGNHIQQNYNNNNHMPQNFQQQPTQIQPGQNNNFIQQQNFNLGRNENGYQQIPSMNIMQQQSPKLQPIQNQRILASTVQQQDLSKITGLVSMEDEVNNTNPLYPSYISSPHNAFQRDYIPNGNIPNLNLNNSNSNNMFNTNTNYSKNISSNFSNNHNNIVQNNINKMNNNSSNSNLNNQMTNINSNITNINNNITNINNNITNINNNMNNNNNNNMINNNNNNNMININNNLTSITNNMTNITNNMKNLNNNILNTNIIPNNNQTIIDNKNNNVAKINNQNSINMNNNSNNINQNSSNEVNSIEKNNININNSSVNNISTNNSNIVQNSSSINNENINNNNLDKNNDENSDNEDNNENDGNNDKVKENQKQSLFGIQPQKKGRGRPRKITSDILSSMPITKKANTISSDSNTGLISSQIKNQISELKNNNNRPTRSSNRIESSSSVQVGNSVKESIHLTSFSKGKVDETSSALTRGDMLVSDKIEEDFEINLEDGYVPTEEDIKAQQRILEAIQRKKYKDELKKKSQEQYTDDEESEDSVIDDKNFVPNSLFLKSYRQRLIGRSSNSKIFELKDSSSDQNIGEVVKQVPHKMSNHHQVECGELRNEHRFLKKMCHPRIITLGSNTEFIRDRNFCGIVLPQAQCNLMQFAKTQRHGKVSLSQIRVAFRQIAESIQYLHDNYISHNDIKPDNMFVFSDDDYKLADFGFAIDLPKPNSFKRNSHFSQTLRKQTKIENLKKDWKQRCKQYVAPELIKLLNGKRPRSPSDEKSCDVFALGVSFFIIIFYQLPFCGSALKTDQRYKHFFKGQFEKFWSQFNSMLTKFQLQENAYTEELKDLFNKVLEPEPTQRLTIEQVLEHPWLNH